MSETIELQRKLFNDVDLFAEWETGLGWDVVSTQLSAGCNEIGFDHFELQGLVVANFVTKQSMMSKFAIPEGMTLLLLCRTKLPLVWSGHHVPPQIMPIVASRREYWAVIPAGMNCYQFLIPDDLLERTECLPQAFLATKGEVEHSYLPLAEPITSHFVRALDGVFGAVRHANDSTQHTVKENRFFDLIIYGLQQVADAGLLARGSQEPRRSRRPDLVRRGIDFIEANLTEQISMSDVAEALGVSYRVLNYAFKDSLNMSPYQYILKARLHATRRDIKAAEGSISKVCLNYGFETPSRFSRQYKRLFGELPSKTKNKCGVSR